MTPAQADVLRLSVEKRKNILVAGGTSTGKTTLTNALLAEVAKTSDRVVLIRESAQDTVSDVGQQIVRRQLNIQPTLTIRPGFPVRIVVNRDLVMRSYGAAKEVK